MSDEFVERRETPRIPVAARVRFTDRPAEEVCFTDNLSEGGLYLKMDKPPFVGTEIELEISVPNTEGLVRVKGEIVWRHEGRGCGVRFGRTTAKTRELLRSFISEDEKK